MAYEIICRTRVIGNLGAVPDVRYTSGGDVVATLRLATTDRYKDAKGEQRESTEWHRVVLFRRLAEIARDFLAKGSAVYIEGRIKTRKWQDRDGQTRYTTEIEAEQLKLLDPAPAREGKEVETRPTQTGRKESVRDDPDPWLNDPAMGKDAPLNLATKVDDIPF